MDVRSKNGRHKYKKEEGDSEIMPGSTELSTDGFTAGGLDVTHQLVSRAETKLVGLHANRSQLRRRIRALHYLLKTFEKAFTPFDSSDPGLHAAPESKSNHDGSSEFEKSSDGALRSRNESKETTTSKPAVTEVSTELRRACRIALMESDRPQSCGQILQRICRRESFCVEGFNDPMIAIAQELRKMLAEGEVIQKKDNQLWQLNRDSRQVVSERNSARK